MVSERRRPRVWQEISYHKARALLPLVSDVSTTVDTPSRPNRYFFELQRLADEIEKGARGGLRTVDGIEKAVDLIQQGKPIDEAIDKVSGRSCWRRASMPQRRRIRFKR